MPRIQNPTIQLPTERLEQLKNIGLALGTKSIGETIGRLVRAEIERGTIPDTLPGVSITRQSKGILLALDDDMPVSLTAAGAKSLADTVRDYADGNEASGKLFNVDFGYIIARQGNGIKLTIPFKDGTTKSFSRDVARDFARLLEAAAA